ncbi:MAG: hypothetical protein ACXITV_06970 [Luteibaculaceae bacterium]
MTKYLQLVVVIALTLAVGYLRDFIFENINWTIKYVSGGLSINYAHPLFSKMGLASVSAGKLELLKWALTLFWIVLSTALSVWAVKIVLEKKQSFFIRLTILAYLLLSALAFALYGFSVLSKLTYELYPMVRAFIGAAQSPLPLLVLLPAAKLLERNQ